MDEAPTAIGEPSTRNARAYEQYLRASERLLRYTGRGTREAIEMLRDAVRRDAGFAEGWARLAAAAVAMGALFDPDPQWLVQAEEAIGRALELDPTNVEAWTARGRMLWSPQHGFRHAEALRDFARAHERLSRPHDAPLWARRGEPQRAEEQIGRALADLKSLSHAHHTRHYLAAALATIEQPERALEQLRLAAQTGLPNYPLFVGDPHFAPLRTRPDFTEFLAGVKTPWEAYRREFGA